MDGTVDLLFYPVGQGLFSSGAVSLDGRAGPFCWVYDCGSSSSASAVRIERSLSLLARELGPRREVDLLVLSHFDSDHIGGIVKLLGRFRVGTLVIPFVPLWHRLVIHFGRSTYVSKRVARFHLDPIGSLRALAGDSIGRIVVVPPSGGDGPPQDGDVQVIIAPPRGEPDRRDPDQDSQVEGLRASQQLQEFHDEDDAETGSHAPVYKLPPGGRFTLRRWEFVPYNDASTKALASPEFVAHAESRRRALLSAGSEEMRRDALKALKRHYESTFTTSKNRNLISLFLFAGATHRSRDAHCHRCELSGGSSSRDFDWPCTTRHAGPGVLYTGDGYLNNPARWNSLARYLGPKRIASLLAFQVMHHGARGNWYPGLASQVGAPFSVFTADPAHKGYGHPHAEVRDDFDRASCAKLVNDRGFRLSSSFS